MISSILQIVASIAGVFAALYVNKIIKQYLQRWEDTKQKNESEKVKDELAEELKRRQEELDRFRDIENKLP